MTIDEALEEMNTLFIPRDGIQDKLADAYDMSIASLEAWKKIKQEIDEQYDGVHPYNISCAEGLEMALGIIDKHLQEVASPTGAEGSDKE
jgi:hypothetical protein